MKKILKLIAVICVILFSLIACGEQTNNAQQVEQGDNLQETINSENNNNESSDALVFSAENALIEVENVSGLENTTKLSEQEISEIFNFGETEILEKEIRSEITESSIAEIGIVKVQDKEQAWNIMQAFLSRHEELKNKYAANEEILRIIVDSDSYILKQEGQYVTYILSENANEINEKINGMPRA